MRAAALAGLNRMFVQWLQALLEELDQRRSSTAWSQNPQARGARLSERKQMVTWIVQHVPSTPALCLACSTLPQQTLLIIDVLEWPHHHWILQTGRNIKVITAPLTYLLYCNAGLLQQEWTCWNFLESTIHILDLSVSAYETVVLMVILYIAYLTTVGTYLIRTTYL